VCVCWACRLGGAGVGAWPSGPDLQVFLNILFIPLVIYVYITLFKDFTCIGQQVLEFLESFRVVYMTHSLAFCPESRGWVGRWAFGPRFQTKALIPCVRSLPTEPYKT
jgi:hypothetical protein